MAAVKHKKSPLRLSDVSVIFQIAGVILLIACLFSSHPLVLTIFFPAGILAVGSGFLLWVAYVILSEQDYRKK